MGLIWTSWICSITYHSIIYVSIAQYISLWSVQYASITSQSAWQFANIKSNIDPVSVVDCFTSCTQLNNVSMNAINPELTQSICILKSPNSFAVKSTTGLRQQQMVFLKSVWIFWVHVQYNNLKIPFLSAVHGSQNEFTWLAMKFYYFLNMKIFFYIQSKSMMRPIYWFFFLCHLI